MTQSTSTAVPDPDPYAAPRVSYDTSALPPLPDARAPHPQYTPGPWLNPPRPDGGRSPYYGGLFRGWGEHARAKDNWDIHVYAKPGNKTEREFSARLHDAIRREFPEVHLYTFYDRPVGPHPIPQFELDVFGSDQLGALLSFLVANHGPLSVLVHPNTGDARGDHDQRAIWLGPKLVLDLESLGEQPAVQLAREAKEAAAAKSEN
ncbi:hypothetical protein VHUM_01260 [Vanrija humicola]|uniref:DOPA 4,5-dioxygenase n=1 Tax=Vanrija humicola TaxID=5417 RepID=A0A7D8V2S9_VANHU|nr:hypothetical protein VHUM_01260 [Vanrija humicola]